MVFYFLNFIIIFFSKCSPSDGPYELACSLYAKCDFDEFTFFRLFVSICTNPDAFRIDVPTSVSRCYSPVQVDIIILHIIIFVVTCATDMRIMTWAHCTVDFLCFALIVHFIFLNLSILSYKYYQITITVNHQALAQSICV